MDINECEGCIHCVDGFAFGKPYYKCELENISIRMVEDCPLDREPENEDENDYVYLRRLEDGFAYMSDEFED